MAVLVIYFLFPPIAGNEIRHIFIFLYHIFLFSMHEVRNIRFLAA